MAVLHRRTTLGRLIKPVSDSQLLHRRTGLGHVVKRVGDSRVPATIRSSLADVHPPKGVKSGLAAAGGLIGLTAASAAVSARRRRSQSSSHS
jgi:hypothetical protein